MQDVDGGWAWVVMMAAFSTQFVTGVLSYGVGVFHNAFLNEFQGDLTMTSLVGSIFASLLSLLGPIVSFVINKWSCRVADIISGVCIFLGLCSSYFAPNLITLIFTFGVIAGTGLGFSGITAVIVVGYSFEKYRGIAVGLNVAGAGLGMFASGPFIQYLIDQYGLRGALLILGAFGGQNIVFGALMRPTKIEMSYKHSNETSSENRKMCNFRCDILRNKSFLCILTCSFLWNVPYAILFIHLPRFSVVYGATDMQAASLITMIGVGSTLNRFLAGMVLGPGGIDPLLLNFGFLGIFGLTTATFPLYCTNYIGQNIYSLITGIYSGGLIVLINPLCIEIVGISHLSTAVGLYFTWAGIAWILGGPFAGFLIDNDVSYEGLFFISGAICVLGAFVSLCASLWHKVTDKVEKTASFVDFKESRFLSGSAYFSGSFTVIIENEKTQQLHKSSEDFANKSVLSKNSVESLFIDKHTLNDVIYPKTVGDSSALELENFTPRSRRKLLAHSDHNVDQLNEFTPLQIQEIRVVPLGDCDS
ncbi:monocarboxylate transporter 12-like [Saccostrea echinata]|uniref:monocarboxylate transporter 12-like n=1 Tax=Saccostrea echinata TaxID=191078 RepID=UPI002A833DD0|nr:monocarboxylate transporter 12-like [Saccostrea echinata]